MSVGSTQHIDGRSCPIDSLDAAQIAGMYALLADHFEGCSRRQFDDDLAAKSDVILLEHDGHLVGFSTCCRYRHSETRILFSGDTIVAPAHWGSPALATTWLAAIDRWRAEAPTAAHYWFLICSGFRTFRFLPVFWQRFHPGPTERDDPTLAPLLQRLAEERFGGAYDPTSGIIRLPQAQVLRADLREAPPGRQRDPLIAFFLERNPGHAAGDELACLVALDPANQSRLGRRTWPLAE
jgi:hypothetical protein